MLDSRVWVPEFGFLVLDSWDWTRIPSLGFSVCVSWFDMSGLRFPGLDFPVWNAWFGIPGLDSWV